MIIERRVEDEDRELGYRETTTRAVCQAVHAAAGNKGGAREAARMELFTRRSDTQEDTYEGIPVSKLPRTEQVEAMFGG